jgi:hypothetical protein
VLELGEDEGGPGYLRDAVGVCGDVLEGGPALGERGEPALSLAAQLPGAAWPANRLPHPRCWPSNDPPAALGSTTPADVVTC